MESTSERIFSSVKFSILIFMILIFYYRDIDNLSLLSFGIFLGRGFGYLVAALSLLISGIILRKSIMKQYASVSNRSYLWGIATFVLSIGTYVWGSYNPPMIGLYHYESLLLFVSGYIILRFNTSTVRMVSPLLIMLGLLPLPFVIPLSNTIPSYAPPAIASFILVAFYTAYLRLSPAGFIISLSMAVFSLICWFFPSLSLFGMFNLIIAAFQGSRSFRNRFGLEPEQFKVKCEEHKRINAKGFCYACGRQVRVINETSWNFGSLVIIILMVLAVTQMKVPLLTLQNNNAQLSYAAYNGWQNVSLPAPPPGWLKYNLETNVVPGDIYSSKVIVIPAYHPETKNYTITYEVSSLIPNFLSGITSSPGYKWSSTPYQVDGLDGNLIVGANGNGYLLFYTVRSTLLFINYSDFVTLNTGLTIQRQFPGNNFTADRDAFMNDVSTLLYTSNIQSIGGTWNLWAGSALYDLYSSVNLILLLSSAGVISSLTYVILFINRKHLKSIQEASLLERNEWALLSLVSMLKKSRAVGTDIVKTFGGSGDFPGLIDRVIDTIVSLERKGLLKGVIYEDGGGLKMIWKVSG